MKKIKASFAWTILAMFSTMVHSMEPQTESSSQPQVHIRAAAMEEVSLLNELIALSTRELSKNHYTDVQVESALKYVYGVDKDLIEDRTYYVIIVDDQIAGCGGYSRRSKLFGGSQYAAHEDIIFLHPATDAANIRAFFIHPAHARKGYGQKLLQHCENEAAAQGYKRFELMATLPGIGLYLKNKYVKEKDETLVFEDGVCLPLVLMKKINV